MNIQQSPLAVSTLCITSHNITQFSSIETVGQNDDQIFIGFELILRKKLSILYIEISILNDNKINMQNFHSEMEAYHELGDLYRIMVITSH